MNLRYFYFTLLFLAFLTKTKAQDDLMKELEKITPKEKHATIATFKGTRLINLHTVETLKKGSLDFRISHRFGDISSGSKNLWGLDGPATLRLGLDYSLTDRLVVGLGRTNYQKMFDGFVKYKIVRQFNESGSPVSLVILGSTNITSDTDPNKDITGVDRFQYFSNRVSYSAQLMVARKFSRKISLQVTPIFIHYNLVTKLNDKNDLFAVALSGRFKFTKSLALTGEYIARITKYSPDFVNYKNVASIGLDIETGGHVFQLFFTNASAINEVQLIPFTASSWSKQEYRFGFNISRVFDLGKKKV